MTGPSLEGCFLKLARAKEQRDELKRELGPALDTVHVSVLTETLYDVSAQQFAVKVVYAPELPPRLSVIAGDVVHNLRSALDYVAFQAVWKNKGKPWRRSQFPLVSGPTCFSKGDLVLLRKIGPTFAAIVKRNQPFEDINDYVSEGLAADLKEAMLARRDNSALEVLRELSNLDKHRLLLPRWARGANIAVVPTKTLDCDPVPSWYSDEGSLERGTVIAVFNAHPSGPRPQMEVDFNFTPSAGIGASGDAQSILDTVASKVLRIVREFEPFF